MDEEVVALVAVALFGGTIFVKVVLEALAKPKLEQIKLEEQYLQRMLDELGEVRMRLDALEATRQTPPRV